MYMGKRIFVDLDLTLVRSVEDGVLEAALQNGGTEADARAAGAVPLEVGGKIIWSKPRPGAVQFMWEIGLLCDNVSICTVATRDYARTACSRFGFDYIAANIYTRENINNDARGLEYPGKFLLVDDNPHTFSPGIMNKFAYISQTREEIANGFYDRTAKTEKFVRSGMVTVRPYQYWDADDNELERVLEEIKRRVV